MKRLHQYILTFLVTALPLFSMAQGFEGVVRFKAENKKAGEISDIEWYLKNGSSKLKIHAVSKELTSDYCLYFIKNSGTITLTAEGDGKKLKYNLPLSAFSKSEFSDAFYAASNGKTSAMNGFSGEEVIVKTSDMEVQCLVSNSTGLSPDLFPSIILGRGIFNILQRNGISGIPVHILAKDFAGNVVLEHQIIQVSKQGISDNEFIVPSDYQSAN
jgi:hypothetical protein